MMAGRTANKRGRTDGEPAFVQLPWWLIESPAFHALSSDGKIAVLYLTKRFNGRNNGEIVFGVRSGSRVRNPGQPDTDTADRAIMPRMRLARALSEAVALKLVAVTKESSFGQKKMTREWRLAWLPTKGGIASREFMALSEADCAAILSALKTKASPTSGTVTRRTVPPAGQPTPPNATDKSVQSHQRDYSTFPQSHGRDTSSNHPIGAAVGTHHSGKQPHDTTKTALKYPQNQNWPIGAVER